MTGLITGKKLPPFSLPNEDRYDKQMTGHFSLPAIQDTERAPEIGKTNKEGRE